MERSPLTRAEATEYGETSRHADVVAFVEALAARGDPRLHVSDFGRSPEGRSLPLLVLSEHRHFTPAEAHGSGLPVVLVINGIHAGEVEGKEASSMLVRDLLDGAHERLLERLTLVVVPLFNPDGNDRIDPAHRKLDVERKSGQMGPDSGVGTRTTPAGINLNRDYLRQDAPEMRALMERVAQVWDAHLVVDCHATNGSIHRFALTYDVPHVVASGRPEPIAYMRERLLPDVTAAVKRADGLDLSWYGNFLRDEGGAGEGWMTYTHHPRFGGNYRGLTNRLDLLLEAYSYIAFSERVRVTYATLRETLRHVAAHGTEIVDLLERCRRPPDRIAVRYRLEAVPDAPIRVLTREPYTLEGAPVECVVPHYAHFVPELVVDRPLAYAVPADIAERLARHALPVEAPRDGERFRVEIARVRGRRTEAGRGILEAESTVHLDVEWRSEQRALPDGWRLVRADGRYGAIAVYLCEPGSDDGLVDQEWVAEPAVGDDFTVWRVLGRA